MVLAEAKVTWQRVPSASWQVACLAPKVRVGSNSIGAKGN